MTAAEAVGSFVLVLTIICTAIASTLAAPVAGAPFGSLVLPLGGGLALASIVAGLGSVLTHRAVHTSASASLREELTGN